MTNSILESLVKKRKKTGDGKWKLSAFSENTLAGLTTHDFFTILLIATAIIIVIVL